MTIRKNMGYYHATSNGVGAKAAACGLLCGMHKLASLGLVLREKCGPNDGARVQATEACWMPHRATQVVLTMQIVDYCARRNKSWLFSA